MTQCATYVLPPTMAEQPTPHPWLEGVLQVGLDRATHAGTAEIFSTTVDDIVEMVRSDLARGWGDWVVVALRPEASHDTPVPDDVVGYCSVQYDMSPGATSAYLEPVVRMVWRGQGVGSLLHEAALGQCRHLGRTRVEAWTFDSYKNATEDDWAHGGTVGDDRYPASREVDILKHWGYTPGLFEQVNTVALPLPEATWQILDEHGADRNDGYRIVDWRGVDASEDNLAGFARLLSMASDEIPSGDLEPDPEEVTVENLITVEQSNQKSGITTVVVCAQDDAGQVVGTSNVVFRAGDKKVSQAYTLVDPAHRGHGLGWRMKRRLHQIVEAEAKDAQRVTTWNAAQNAPMLHINHAMGYEPYAFSVGWHRAVERS